MNVWSVKNVQKYYNYKSVVINYQEMFMPFCTRSNTRLYLKAVAKSIDSCQPARNVQTDMNRNFPLSSKFLPAQRIMPPHDSVGC